MATIYYRSVPCDVYEVLQAHDAPPRELYLWCSLGPKAQRTHLVRFHPRTVRHLCDDVADALAQLAEDGLVVYEKTGLTWTVFLAGNAEYLYPKDWGTREGWINDSASDPDSEPKRAMLELLDAKCAKRRPTKRDPSQTAPTPLRQGRGDTGEERKGKEQEQEPPTEVVVADAPNTAPEEADMLKDRPLAKRAGKYARGIEVLKLYEEICVPAGMKGFRKTSSGGYAVGVRECAYQAVKRWGPSLEDWREFFTYCTYSPFLTGKVAPSAGRDRFVGSFAWIVGKTNRQEIDGGKYHPADSRVASAEPVKRDYVPLNIPWER